MEIGLREWLIVIGIIVIAGILFDGWRRMRGGKGKLKFRLDRNLSNLPDDDGAAELLGPPRVLDTHKEPQLDEHDLPSMSAPLREAREPSSKRGKRGSAAVAEPHQGDLNLDVDDGPSFSSRDDDFPDETSSKSAARQSVNDQPAAEEVLSHQRDLPRRRRFQGPGTLAEHPRKRPAFRRDGYLPSSRKHGW